ncbi:hypothetical protein Cgig2_016224 [Carnegiea gigantea]|uniref:Uncharacterized protein n=1 Tax=Carnegiea gigantea TaxID=171969 RepID=A0A9Q1JGV5_9CARY|nr:hypothetical protein Cgig2_016224 [Carnegiea gigantea]
MASAVEARGGLWDALLELTKSAQEKNSDPLHWAIQLSSSLNSAGMTQPSVELAYLLVSHICWSNNVPIAWKFLDKALALKIAPPSLVLTLLSTSLPKPTPSSYQHKATGSGKKMENLLPLPFFEIFNMSSLFPTTLRSNDLLSIATNFLHPPSYYLLNQSRMKRTEQDTNPRWKWLTGVHSVKTNATSRLSLKQAIRNSAPAKIRRDSGRRKSRRRLICRRRASRRGQKPPTTPALTSAEENSTPRRQDLRNSPDARENPSNEQPVASEGEVGGSRRPKTQQVLGYPPMTVFESQATMTGERTTPSLPPSLHCADGASKADGGDSSDDSDA